MRLLTYTFQVNRVYYGAWAQWRPYCTLYTFPNFNGCTVEIWKCHHRHYDRCNYLYKLGLKLIHISKWGPQLCTPFKCMIFFIWSSESIYHVFNPQFSIYQHGDIHWEKKTFIRLLLAPLAKQNLRWTRTSFPVSLCKTFQHISQSREPTRSDIKIIDHPDNCRVPWQLFTTEIGPDVYSISSETGSRSVMAESWSNWLARITCYLPQQSILIWQGNENHPRTKGG